MCTYSLLVIKVHFKIHHKGPDGEQTYSSALSLTQPQGESGRSMPLSQGKRPSSHCTGGWVRSRVSLDECRKSHAHQD